MLKPWIFVFIPALIALPVRAEQFHASQWAEGSSARTGATRDYFDFGAFLKWRKRGGDWYDADGALYGSKAFSVADIKDQDKERKISWDVTDLVRKWLEGAHPNTGFFLKPTGKNDGVFFHSKEASDSSKAPRLRISYSGSDTQELMAVADTHLDVSTYKSSGGKPKLAKGHKLIRFDTGKLQKSAAIQKAELVLHTTAKQYGNSSVGVFRPAPEVPVAQPTTLTGIAERYPNDKDIEDDKDVIFVEKFESFFWKNSWTDGKEYGSYDRVSNDSALKFEPLSGDALKVVIKEGTHTGLGLRYKFAEETGEEPEEAYFRYYLRFAPDWQISVEPGKLPGLAGTYGRGGWGGRPAKGTNGWSMRGLFELSVDKSSPLAGLNPIGTYAYHVGMKKSYGDHWVWVNSELGIASNNIWYCIEQYVKLNTVGKSDGIFRAWMDGKLVYERTDMQYRTSPDLKIETLWMNVYHGGKKKAPHDHTLYLDNIVVAKRYIGPIKK